MKNTGVVILVLSAVLSASSTVKAQPAGKIYRVGYLTLATSTGQLQSLEAFRQRLRELGWTEGRNIALETRFGEDQRDRLPSLAADLVRLNVDVIVTITTPAAQAAKAATGTIPIVMAGSAEPVALGLVASLARPGGNVTGVTNSPGPEFFAKQIQLLKDIAPGISRVGILTSSQFDPEVLILRAARDVPSALGVVLVPIEVTRDVFDPAALGHARPDALFMFPNGPNWAHRAAVMEFAMRNRLPTMWPEGREGLIETGALLSYNTDWLDLRRRAAVFVDKILRGGKPADLPVEEPSKFELIVNLKAARALGLTIPQSILIRTDDVIQ
jgi:putative ABC transport system substrate-binding protein